MVSTLDVISIMRNVTAREDRSDPLFTDEKMRDYLNNFITQQSSIDVRLFKNYTWWEFSIGPGVPGYIDPLPVDLQTLGFSTISNPAYISGPNVPNPQYPSSMPLSWYQDPTQFYAKWPPYQTFTPQRPVDVLWFNNELTFRGPPDQDYKVKIQAYKEELQCDLNDNIPVDYLYRYLAYGAALDIFSDFMEMENYNTCMPVFMKYRGLVQARTWQQFITQRTTPQW